ncbi:hypothetical protein OU5_6036 [Pseudomonas mandelii JR-1]|uniref:Uncharacterized protein n=1 Tax=Pseudomonas mandelii JR-1 TaxID=1147786 RepID=A0A024EKK8_9PSED|nr:hypothetical protein OU5_6036 [Pseudomonas mandelii JR-1]
MCSCRRLAARHTARSTIHRRASVCRVANRRSISKVLFSCVLTFAAYQWKVDAQRTVYWLRP